MRVLLSWSSGKDAAWALHRLHRQADVEVVALLTTLSASQGRVAVHGLRRSLVETQAAATGLPLWIQALPSPCTNVEYEAAMHAIITRAKEAAVTHMAFGDLFLQDVRDYRERMLEGTGIDTLFPLWGASTRSGELAHEMLNGGLRATLISVDLAKLPASFAGRDYNANLLHDLPPDVDLCGENGEFHTFCYGGPMFSREIEVCRGESVSHDGFCYADLSASP